LAIAPKQLAAVAALIDQQLVRSAHDCSEGGMLVAAAEMAIAGRLGLDLNLAGVPQHDELDNLAACFAETPTRILLELEPDKLDAVARLLKEQGVPFGQIGYFNDTRRLTVRNDAGGTLADLAVEDLWAAWRKPLDW